MGSRGLSCRFQGLTLQLASVMERIATALCSISLREHASSNEPDGFRVQGPGFKVLVFENFEWMAAVMKVCFSMCPDCVT